MRTNIRQKQWQKNHGRKNAIKLGKTFERLNDGKRVILRKYEFSTLCGVEKVENFGE